MFKIGFKFNRIQFEINAYTNELKISFSLFVFIENRFLSHILYPDYSFFSLCSSKFPPISPTLCFSIENNKFLKKNKYDKNIIKQSKGFHDEVGHGKQPGIRRTGSRVRQTCSNSHHCHNNTKLKAIIYMQKTWCRPM